MGVARQQSAALEADFWDNITTLLSSSGTTIATPTDDLAGFISASGSHYDLGSTVIACPSATLLPPGHAPSYTSHSTFSSPTGSSPVSNSAVVTTPSDFLMPSYRLHRSTDLTAHEHKRKRDRERNTEAARRYRKRRVDETDDLRAALAAMTKERDELRLKLVRAEAEASLLRKLHVTDLS